jgi:hypothetical protein
VEYLFAATLVAVALVAPALWTRKPGKKRHSAMSGAFAALDEVFHPAGKQATEQLAEQSQASKPLPSPEDKEL